MKLLLILCMMTIKPSALNTVQKKAADLIGTPQEINELSTALETIHKSDSPETQPFKKILNELAKIYNKPNLTQEDIKEISKKEKELHSLCYGKWCIKTKVAVGSATAALIAFSTWYLTQKNNIKSIDTSTIAKYALFTGVVSSIIGFVVFLWKKISDAFTSAQDEVQSAKDNLAEAQRNQQAALNDLERLKIVNNNLKEQFKKIIPVIAKLNKEIARLQQLEEQEKKLKTANTTCKNQELPFRIRAALWLANLGKPKIIYKKRLENKPDNLHHLHSELLDAIHDALNDPMVPKLTDDKQAAAGAGSERSITPTSF